ncbi:MAG: hypothetical protein ACJAR0_004597 [Candidatus Azotimanducaceae bacterium]|jgi:hypothetical protein
MNKSPEIVLAFAFSLLPDGSPGSYNEILARQIHRYLEEHQKQSDDPPLVAMQWEIADALMDLYPTLVETLTDQQKFFVVEPPRFQATDEDGHKTRLETWLTKNVGQNGRTLTNRLNLNEGSSMLSRLNNLLDDGDLFKDFPRIQFDNLVRPDFGEIFTELREIPSASQYPNGLRRFQRIRVNRLIIESIVQDRSIVKSGRYLSTPGVIDAVLEYCVATDQPFGNVTIFAHPLHAPRCTRQTNDALMAHNLNGKIIEKTIDEDFPWDSSGAQTWCQSLANWNQYEARVQEWLNARHH